MCNSKYAVDEGGERERMRESTCCTCFCVRCATRGERVDGE